MTEKSKEFFKKLNNGYIIAAICVILIGVIVLGAMISLVAHPFATNTTYTAKVKQEIMGETFTTRAKLILMDEGRYSITLKDGSEYYTYFGDYGYGKLLDEDNARHSMIWFEYDGQMSAVDKALFGGDDLLSSILGINMSELSNPFKIQYGEVTFTNVGGILLLVFYCFVIVVCAAIAAILIVKRKDGNMVFTSKVRLVKRLRELEDMLGVRHDV